MASFAHTRFPFIANVIKLKKDKDNANHENMLRHVAFASGNVSDRRTAAERRGESERLVWPP